jgi:nucleoside-diphosphate-sugar epimerase
VRDAVGAYLTLADGMAAAVLAGEAFNFGNERPYTVLEVVERILTFMGKSHLTPVILNQASEEIANQYLDCAKARRDLSWRPRYAFEEGLAETVPWYQEQVRRSM